MSGPQALLFFLLVLGAVATALRLVSRQAEFMAYQVVLALGGLALGLVPGVPIPQLGPDLILLAFVPGLVFEAAIGLDLADLWRMAVPVTLLATAGVAVTVIGLGVAVHLILGLSLPASFLLGGILAATDPIAVVSLLRRVGAPGRLTAILEGESLFNDGTGVAVFSAILASILGGGATVADAGLRFMVLTGGGAAVGAVVGTAAIALLRRETEAELEILATLLAAYGSYLLADLLHVSGVVSVVVAGVVVARFGRRAGQLYGRQLLGFWNVFGFIMNAVLFVLVGSAVPRAHLVEVAPLIAVSFLLLLAARAVIVYPVLGLSDRHAGGLPWSWRHLAVWGGIRGALGVALALAVSGRPGIDQRVPAIAFGAVFLSLLIQGGLVHPLAGWLGLAGTGRAMKKGAEPGGDPGESSPRS